MSTLLDKVNDPEATALASTDASMALFERLARDPDASVDKIERLMALWERGEARKAESAFNAAMAAAQKEMRPVAADAFNPQTRSRYASYEALDEALRPLYTKHGFALSFNTGDATQADYVRMLCDVTHIGGHSKQYRADLPADGKGAKGGDVMTKTHAFGSATSYGMRYLLRMIWNVAVGEDDDDGNRAGQKKTAAKEPDGYQEWLDDMTAVADNGIAELQTAWNKSKSFYRDYITKNAPQTWAGLKAKAAKVGQ